MKKFLIVSGIFICSALLLTSANTPDSGYKIGSEAIGFTLKSTEGKMVSLSDYEKAKGFIVIFTCNTCPYAKLYEDRIIALHNKYSSQGYPVIAINPNDATQQPGDSFEKMQVRAKEKAFPFPYLTDQTQEVTKAYGASRTPHVFVLKKEGDKNIVAYIGAIDNNHKSADEATVKYVENAVDALLEGEAVTEPFTKAIGCTIKWKSA